MPPRSVIQVVVTPEQAKAIDVARDGLPRSAWVRALVEQALTADANEPVAEPAPRPAQKPKKRRSDTVAEPAVDRRTEDVPNFLKR